jgi:hypothetical protein
MNCLSVLKSYLNELLQWKLCNNWVEIALAVVAWIMVYMLYTCHVLWRFQTKITQRYFISIKNSPNRKLSLMSHFVKVSSLKRKIILGLISWKNLWSQTERNLLCEKVITEMWFHWFKRHVALPVLWYTAQSIWFSDDLWQLLIHYINIALYRLRCMWYIQTFESSLYVR